MFLPRGFFKIRESFNCTIEELKLNRVKGYMDVNDPFNCTIEELKLKMGWGFCYHLVLLIVP